MVWSAIKSIFGKGEGHFIAGSFEANEATRGQIAQHGDDGIIEREVEHFLIPGIDAKVDQEHISDLLAERGIAAFEAESNHGVVGTHVVAIATVEFDDLTAALRDDLNAVGWSYDGWGCGVVRNEGN